VISSTVGAFVIPLAAFCCARPVIEVRADDARLVSGVFVGCALGESVCVMPCLGMTSGFGAEWLCYYNTIQANWI